MRVGVLQVRLLVRGSTSLKEKRKVILSVKDRLRSRFNCAVAETEDLDNRQLATLGIAAVSNESAHLQSMLGKILDFVRACPYAEVVGTEMEIF